MSTIDLVQCNLSGDSALLLQSENLYMKMKIRELEFDLECAQRKSRYFEGVSKIALFELEKGNWVNSSNKRNRLLKVLEEVEDVKLNLVNIIQKLDNFVCSIKNILQ